MNYSISFKTFKKYCKHKFIRETLSKESSRKGQGKYGCDKLILHDTDLTSDDMYNNHPKFPLSATYDPRLTTCNQSNCPVIKRLSGSLVFRDYTTGYHNSSMAD